MNPKFENKAPAPMVGLGALQILFALMRLYTSSTDLPWDSPWAQLAYKSSVTSVSGVLYCCVDRNIFPESLSWAQTLQLQWSSWWASHPPAWTAQPALVHFASRAARNVSSFWPIRAHHVVPDRVHWFSLHQGVNGGASLLHSTRSSELSLASVSSFPCIYPERGTLTSMQIWVAPSFSLGGYWMRGFNYVFIRFIKCSSCQGLWAHR